jgi:hypothetical protein
MSKLLECNRPLDNKIFLLSLMLIDADIDSNMAHPSVHYKSSKAFPILRGNTAPQIKAFPKLGKSEPCFLF